MAFLKNTSSIVLTSPSRETKPSFLALLANSTICVMMWSGLCLESKITDLNSLAPAEEKQFDSVGPVVGQELKRRAYIAIGTVLFLIVIYIAFAFRKVSRPVAPWKYGLAAIIALFHDIFIPTGIFSILLSLPVF